MSASSDLAAQIRRLAEQLLDPKVRSDRAALERLLAAEFVEFGSSGRVFDRAAVIAALADESGIAIALHEFRATALSPEYCSATERRLAIASSRWFMRRCTRPICSSAAAAVCASSGNCIASL